MKSATMIFLVHLMATPIVGQPGPSPEPGPLKIRDYLPKEIPGYPTRIAVPPVNTDGETQYGVRYTNPDTEAAVTVTISYIRDPIHRKPFEKTDEEHARDNAFVTETTGSPAGVTVNTKYRTYKAYEDQLGPDEEYALHILVSDVVKVDVFTYKTDPKLARSILDRMDLARLAKIRE